MDNYSKLQEVLKELFEMDKADLDFGIYRIMNQKRDQVMDFIERQLPKDIKSILAHTQSKDSVEFHSELEKMGKALDAAGVVREIAPNYIALKSNLENTIDTAAIEQEVFSHLASFFKRYYKEGDFISMRRYKKDVYAIPYEGEEVKLYWANQDQYYIKTSEYLKNYTFKLADGKKVHFQLKEASTEQNNNKLQGNLERRFAIYEQLPLEDLNGELFVNFTFEPYGKAMKQDDLTKQAFVVIQANIPAAFARAFDKAPTAKNKSRTLIEKHLNDFISRNSFDYFIHKDLGGFLHRELDFYIKNEVLYIDDINTENPAYFTAQLSKVKALKTVAEKIITFLAQIEDFQKKLWLKKKFVISTNYCITLDRIPEKYYTEILNNKAQLDEWKALFDVEPNGIDALKDDPYLVLDTKYFTDEFKDKLCAEFDSLDEDTNGLLINSENFQALNLIQETYKEKIDIVHIDPPYNTFTSGFLYKNEFRHSSWLSFLIERINSTYSLLNKDGIFFTHIDENENERLHLLFEGSGFVNLGTLIWDKKAPVTGAIGIAGQHEYVLTQGKSSIQLKSKKLHIDLMRKIALQIAKSSNNEYEAISKWRKWVREQDFLLKSESIYNFVDLKGNIYRSADMTATEQRTNEKFFVPLIHPITKMPCPVPKFGWRYTPETLNRHIENDEIIFGQDHTKIPRRKMLLDDNLSSQMPSVYGGGHRGKLALDNLNLVFPFSHSPEFYSYLLNGFDGHLSPLILDYFSGSGTTGHAAIKLNREDGGNRKYILVEMGTYFNTVTKPRIQKIIYTDSWKNGKPQDKNGISQMFKYQVLESYEDTLNNLRLTRSNDTALLQFSEEAREEYLLGYMLDVETKDHLFNINIFRNPFDYQLKVTENNESVLTKVDLVETFNYLIGMDVDRIQRVKDIKLIEGKTRVGEKTLIIWRNLDTTTQEEIAIVFRKLYDGVRSSEFDQIYINGDHHFENVRTNEDIFKVKLIEETFFKQMFNISEL